MVRVRCQLCGSIGYTAAPHFQSCECGGRFDVVPEEQRRLSYNERNIFISFLQKEQPNP